MCPVPGPPCRLRVLPAAWTACPLGPFPSPCDGVRVFVHLMFLPRARCSPRGANGCAALESGGADGVLLGRWGPAAPGQGTGAGAVLRL